jgi:hypothetical protein
MPHGLLEVTSGEASFRFQVLSKSNESTEDQPSLKAQFNVVKGRTTFYGIAAAFCDSEPDLIKGRAASLVDAGFRGEFAKIFVPPPEHGTPQCDKLFHRVFVNGAPAFGIQNRKQLRHEFKIFSIKP